MSSEAPVRQLKHKRSISVEVYERSDGLWDLEAELTDHKTRDFPLASGVRPVGEPVHKMRLVLSIDTRLNVLAARAHSESVPYPGHCQTIEPAYGQLVGLNLLRGFRQAVRERLGGTAGCTHLTELCSVIPTAAVQAFAGEVFQTHDGSQGGDEARARPFQIDHCHALREDGEAVRLYYPKWYRAPSGEPADVTPKHDAQRPTRETA